MPSLFDPLVFRNGVRAKNRVVLAPMTNPQSHEDGTLGEDELRWLLMRAEGGFGVVTTCAAHVAKDGQGFPHELGAFDEMHLPGLTRLATELRARGATSILQLVHAGLRAPSRLTGSQPWSASEAAEGPGAPDSARAATEEDLRRVIGQFGDAADRARRAGFDGVEIHGAHGYLLTQFLSVQTNRRDDAWGGSLEHRARIVREVARAIRARAPASFVVGVRISPEDFGQAKGLDLDESVQVAQWLALDGVDYVHLSLWDVNPPSKKYPDRHAIAVFRDALPRDLPIIAAGSVWTRQEAERVLELGADAVALARAAIVNPEWANRAADPLWEPRRPPLTPEELHERGVSPPFVEYVRRWKNFVAP